jgi:hypothetical protein
MTTTSHQAFGRARAMLASIAAILASTSGNISLQRMQLNALGPYESRGKGGKRAHKVGRNRIVQRAALKVRNVQHHRKATR